MVISPELKDRERGLGKGKKALYRPTPNTPDPAVLKWEKKEAA